MAILNVTSQQGIDKVVVQWEDAETNAFIYEIFRSRSGGDYSLIGTTTGAKTFDDTAGVFATDTYKIRKGIAPLTNFNNFSSRVYSDPTPGALFHSIQGAVINNISISFVITAGKNVYINWGYGTTWTKLTNGTHTSNFPETNRTYEISVKGDLDGVTQFICQTEPTFKVENVAELWKFTNLQVCLISGVYNYMAGALEGMPSTLTQLTLNPTTNSYGRAGTNQCTLSNPGFIWPSGLTRLTLGSIAGYLRISEGAIEDDNEKIFFSIEDLPSTLTYLNLAQVGNQNYGITGDETNMPPNMVNWLVQGCWGLEWSGGNLPTSLVEWYNENVNDPAFIGDLNTKLPTALTKLFLVGNAAISEQSGITGTMAGIAARCPSLSFIWVTEGFCYNLGSALDGLASLTTLGIIALYTSGTKFSYSGGTLPAWANCSMNIQGKLTTAELDSFLIKYAETAGAGVQPLYFAGNNQARSSASNAAVATLQGLGKTVTTN